MVHRMVALITNSVFAIKNWLQAHPAPFADMPLFTSKSQLSALSVPALTNLVKDWCGEVGLRGNFGSHTLRNTWGYQNRIQKNAPIPLLMQAYGHASQKQTLDYLGILEGEIQGLYMELEL